MKNAKNELSQTEMDLKKKNQTEIKVSLLVNKEIQMY